VTTSIGPRLSIPARIAPITRSQSLHRSRTPRLPGRPQLPLARSTRCSCRDTRGSSFDETTGRRLCVAVRRIAEPSASTPIVVVSWFEPGRRPRRSLGRHLSERPRDRDRSSRRTAHTRCTDDSAHERIYGYGRFRPPPSTARDRCSRIPRPASARMRCNCSDLECPYPTCTKIAGSVEAREATRFTRGTSTFTWSFYTCPVPVTLRLAVPFHRDCSDQCNRGRTAPYPSSEDRPRADRRVRGRGSPW